MGHIGAHFHSLGRDCRRPGRQPPTGSTGSVFSKSANSREQLEARQTPISKPEDSNFVLAD